MHGHAGIHRLRLPHARIQSATVEQLSMGPAFDETAIIEDEEHVGVFH